MRNAIAATTAVALTMSSVAAHAFCGFYVSGSDKKMFNDATNVVLMRSGTRTVLSMQNDYRGPLEDFAMVIPVPVVLKQTDVRVVPFEEVTEEHAFAEGEGDRSLAHWREVHQHFFTEHRSHDREFASGMPVVCESFRVLHAG